MLTCSPPPAVICAENIALLYLLHSVPVPPSCNEIKKSPFRQGGYSLSFVRERDLASTLAFLSNTEDDPNHIPALCVEENPELVSLNVVVAVNKKNGEDGNKALQNIKQSLEKIFTILSEFSEERDNNRAIEHQIFNAIISICSHRILSRLRFMATKRGTPRQPLRVILGEAINSLKQVNHQTLNSLPFSLFTERAKDVIRLADAWVKHQKLAELGNLVEGIYQLKQTRDLQALLDSIPNRAMGPSSRQNLFNIIKKVSRYREAARFLYCTAKKIPLLRRAKVVIASLPKEVFDRVSDENCTPQLTSTIARMNTNCQGPVVRHLCRLLNTSGPQLNDQFADQTIKTMREAKIHAEIQLVFHYELNISRLPPRVVCSSKDACFLCNAFILMHGKMHTPRYHGRLYPGWRLPSMSDLNDLDVRLNSALEDQIKDSLKTLLSRQKKTMYPDPNESTLLTLPLSTSTLRTPALVEVIEWEKASAKSSLVNDTARLQERTISPKDRSSVSLAECIGTVPSALSSRSAITVEDDELPKMSLSDQAATQLSAQCSHQTTRHEVITCETEELIQGMSQARSVIACEPQFHTTDELEIHIEHIAEMLVPCANRIDLEIAYSIEWLSVEKTKELLEHKEATIVDIEALQCGAWHTIDCHDDILIMARGTLVRITPRNEKKREGRR
ncbi:hypothetical protein GGP41_008635 [Bipolaris sorokiniana]|uniref:Uncharacterized protein n=1 Tax=Cochliobolus sativus TaxID=45130 RepID=A0A8H5ZB98_COCSA|nr:hypothetical protein GGP41_008635 [Bipolaris sorokiniana]